MPAPRPLLLLPPSKGKSSGGDGPGYLSTLEPDHPLTAARRVVLDAVATEVSHLDDGAVGRLSGVGPAKVGAARELLADLPRGPTTPAHRRYTGVVHGNAGLADVDPRALDVEVRIVSALLGLVALDEPVPDYRVEFGASLPRLGGLAPFWRDHVAAHLRELAAGRRVWDLLPGEHRRIWSPEVRAALDVVEVAFLRPDGRPANAARAKVAKGRFAAALLARPGLTPRRVARDVDLGEGWSITATSASVEVVFSGG